MVTRGIRHLPMVFTLGLTFSTVFSSGRHGQGGQAEIPGHRVELAGSSQHPTTEATGRTVRRSIAASDSPPRAFSQECAA